MPHIKANYPQNWKDEIRPRILKRDGYKCKICGVYNNTKGFRETDGTFIPFDELTLSYAIQTKKKFITIYLSIAHLDHNTLNNEDSNLVAMCQYHHLAHDRELHRLNRITKSNPPQLPPFSSL